jgi:hypothetical protein
MVLMVLHLRAFHSSMWRAPAGSHTSVVLVEAGAKVTILDDLSNSFLEVLERLKMVLKEKFSNIRFEHVGTPDCADPCDACCWLLLHESLYLHMIALLGAYASTPCAIYLTNHAFSEANNDATVRPRRHDFQQAYA